MLRPAPPIIRLARFVAGEAAPKERVRVLLRAIQDSVPALILSNELYKALFGNPCERIFILLSLEPRIVARDAFRSCEGALEVVPESLQKIRRRILQQSGSYLGTNLHTLNSVL